MNSQADSVLDAALQLPEKERARLAAELVASLDGEQEDGVEAAWAAALRRGGGETLVWCLGNR